MRRAILSLFVLPLFLACPGAQSTTDGGNPDSGSGNTDAGTAPPNAVEGLTAFTVNSAVVLWGNALQDGGVNRGSVRVVISTLTPDQACTQAKTYFSADGLTLKAYDFMMTGSDTEDVKPRVYPVSLDTSMPWAQALYFDVTNGSLTSPTGETVYGAASVTVVGVSWPSVVSPGVVSGGKVDATFSGALEFGGTPDSGVTGSFHATGCDSYPLMPGPT